MMKKTLILGLIVCSLLVVSMNSVVAEDEQLTITDGEEDVFDMDGNIVARKNVDILEVTCIQDGKKVELQLKLIDDDEIQNSENFEYVMILTTSISGYFIDYTNDTLIVIDLEDNEIEEVEYSGVGTDTLTVSFDLLTSDEECLLIIAETYEIDLINEQFFVDLAPDEEDILLADTGGPYEGSIGDNIEFSGEIEDGTSPYTWKWYFGDGETSTEQNPTHSYDEDGIFDVILLVIDGNDNRGIDYTTVTISSNGNDNGDNNNNGNTPPTNNDTDKDDASDSGLLLFGAVIAIIFIIGVAVIVYIIRR